MARFRCENKELAKYWKLEEESKCNKKCSNKLEWIEGCGGGKQSKWTRNSLLDESDEWIKEMKEKKNKDKG